MILDVWQMHWLRLLGYFERNVGVDDGRLVDGLLLLLLVLQMLHLRTDGFVPVVVNLRGGFASLRLGLLAGSSGQVFVDWWMMLMLLRMVLLMFLHVFRRLWSMSVTAGTAIGRV